MCAEFRIRFSIRSLLIAMVRLYQVLVSPFFPSRCRFLPSCSEYAIEAISRHGVLRGMGLSGWRILRCHPLAKSGYDPVPEVRSKHSQQSHLRPETTINP